MRKVVILQSNYIPWKGYFDLIHDADLFIFYDEVNYTKNDWRNRNRIYTVNGLQWLSIPIAKHALKQKISEVKLDNQFWQQKHLKTITLGYKKAIYFSQIEPLLDDFYNRNNWAYLSEMNQYFIKKISGLIGITTRFADSKEFDLKGDRIAKLIYLLTQVKATEYITGPSAQTYLQNSENLFTKHNIKLTYKNYPDYPYYNQLFHPFMNEVSIIDMLANIKISNIKDYIWKTRDKNDKN